MPLRVGFLSAAHLHITSYLPLLKAHPLAEIIGLWDDDDARGREFAETYSVEFYADRAALIDEVDAVVVASENVKHLENVQAAATAGRSILCEKPLVTNLSDARKMQEAVTGGSVRLMTAFPCRFAPAWNRLKERVASGEIGKIRAISATNRGSCPGGWFTQPEQSGGGAMIDHVVHVADLLRDLLLEDPVRVHATTGNNMYGQVWDDTAKLTLEFASGIFATLDSSWSRHSSYRTWGDVTMTIVGEKGVIELDLFGQEIHHYHDGLKSHTVNAFGSNPDAGLIDEFLRSIEENRSPRADVRDGLQAAMVAIAGYRSVASGQPVSLPL